MTLVYFFRRQLINNNEIELRVELKTELINNNEIRFKVEVKSQLIIINEIKFSLRFKSIAGNLFKKVSQSLCAHAARESGPR